MRRLITAAVLATACGARPSPPPSPPDVPPADASEPSPVDAGEPSSEVPDAPAPDAAPPDAAQSSLPPPPATRIDDSVDVYQSVEVRDPYHWLESDSGERAAWLEAQDRRSQVILASLAGRDALREAIRAADRGRVMLVGLGGAGPRVFLRRHAPDERAATLWVRDGWTGADRLLVDPRRRGTTAVHHAIDFAAPSPDGRYLAYGISASGGGSAVELLDVVTGKLLPERIDRVHPASLQWRPDGRSFFYTRHNPPAAGAPAADWFKDSQVYLHRLGDDPDQARPVLGSRIPGLGIASDRSPMVWVAQRSPWAIGSVARGTADSELLVAPLAGLAPGKELPWRRIATDRDQVRAGVARGDKVYLLSHAGAPRYRILELDARRGTLASARVFVAQSDAVIAGVAAAEDALYLHLLDRGVSRLRRVAWEGGATEDIALPFAGTLRELTASDDRRGVRFALASWTRPPALFGYEPGQAVRDLGLVPTAPDRDLTVEEVEVQSSDGTRVPLSIVRRADLRSDGSAPALIEGYAAHGAVLEASDPPSTLAWTARGGVYAACQARGGGERGWEWHQSGIKRHKERGVEDFVACAEYLVARGYTRPERLTALGTGAGGILVGGAITRRPELFAAALLRVPIGNPLRFATTRAGPASAEELGSLAVAEEVRALVASDPFHRVRDATAYPAVMLTGMPDVYVPVWQPAKLAARLQAASTGGPVLLRVETEGPASQEWADLLAFALWRSGVPPAGR